MGGEKLIKGLSLVAIALLAAAAGAGCGDDEAGGDEGPVTTSSLSKEDYVEEANEICARTNNEAAKALQDFLGGEDTDLAAVIDVMADSSQTQHDEIRALGAPAGDEAQLEAVLAAMQQALDEAERKGVETPEEFFEEFKRFDKLAREFGLTRCIVSF